MNFILVDGDICIATHFTCDEEIETQTIGSSTLKGSSKVATGRSITGEILLFRRGELPDLFQRNGMPNPVTVEFSQDDTFYSMGEVMFTSFEQMNRDVYEKCDGAYVEYVAKSISSERVTKDINSRISI